MQMHCYMSMSTTTSISVGAEHFVTVNTTQLWTPTTALKPRTNCSNTPFFQEGNRKLHSLVSSQS